MIVGYRVAIAEREDHPYGPPPRESRNWLRVVRSIMADGNGRAVERREHLGRTWTTARAARAEARLWWPYWHVRIIRVVRRGA